MSSYLSLSGSSVNSSSGFSLIWALNMQDFFKNKQMQCRCGLMVQSSNCEVSEIQILKSSKAFFLNVCHWGIWAQSVYVRQEWHKGVSCHFQLTDTISFCQSVSSNLCCFLKEEEGRNREAREWTESAELLELYFLRAVLECSIAWDCLPANTLYQGSEMHP